MVFFKNSYLISKTSCIHINFFINKRGMFTRLGVIKKFEMLNKSSQAIVTYVTKRPSDVFKVSFFESTSRASTKTQDFLDQTKSSKGISHSIVHTESPNPNKIILNCALTGSDYVNVTDKNTGVVVREPTAIIDPKGYSDGSKLKPQKATTHYELEVDKSEVKLISDPIKTAHVQQPDVTAALEKINSKISDISLESKQTILLEKIKSKL